MQLLEETLLGVVMVVMVMLAMSITRTVRRMATRQLVTTPQAAVSLSLLFTPNSRACVLLPSHSLSGDADQHTILTSSPGVSYSSLGPCKQRLTLERVREMQALPDTAKLLEKCKLYQLSTIFDRLHALGKLPADLKRTKLLLLYNYGESMVYLAAACEHCLPFHDLIQSSSSLLVTFYGLALWAIVSDVPSQEHLSAQLLPTAVMEIARLGAKLNQGKADFGWPE
jgi:hypothetical protein